MTAPPQPQPLPTGPVPIGPMPTAINAWQAQMSDGSIMIAVMVSTPSGNQTFFMSPAGAAALGPRLALLGQADQMVLGS